MLLKDFYTVEKIETLAEGKYSAVVLLNNQHAIFKGHFPGNPITPGVCMMQIIKELSEKILGFSLLLTQATNVKFTAIINPDLTPKLKLELEISEDLNSDVKVKNTTSFGETIALKLTNTYKKA